MKKVKKIVENVDDMHKVIIAARYRKPESLLIFYGWPNAFNSAQNGWDNEKVAQEMARYNLIVLGDGVQEPTHGDYSNSSVIIPRIKELNPETKIFGYVTVNQTLENFKSKAQKWDDLKVDGIFMDEAGYDYGKTRSDFNDRVIFVHGLCYSNICFANAWNLDHILGLENDASYPNSTYNSDSEKSKLDMGDYCLLESFAINTSAYTPDGYENKTNWFARGEKAVKLRSEFGINLVGSGIINDDNSNGTNLFKFGFIAAMMFALEGYGTSDTLYGASSAKTKYWDRPDVTGIGHYWNLEPAVNVHNSDTDIYMRYLDYGKLELDFSSGNESSNIIEY